MCKVAQTTYKFFHTMHDIQILGRPLGFENPNRVLTSVDAVFTANEINDWAKDIME